MINEYMPWTSNSCSATAEFVELMNFGPGPIDIGCYVLTDGDFSLTIPPGTIIQPGDFFVIAGQDIIDFPCANIDSTIHVDLNWNNCRCTNAAIPTTGDGWFTDGGGANEQLVLLDPQGRVADAVVRSAPGEPSLPIDNNDLSGGCSPYSFDLDTMSINYEELGMAPGRANSFARKLDGDCGWVKDPQQSGNATNNTPGDQTDISYSFSYVNARDCSSAHGSISIHVEHSNLTALFPMTYTIAFDSDNNGVFDFNDTYTEGADSVPPSIDIDQLLVGRYRIVVGSVKGCYLQTFNFTILTCVPTLPVSLVYFRLMTQNSRTNNFEWKMDGTEHLASIILERSTDARKFVPELSVPGTENLTGSKIFRVPAPVRAPYSFYRLRMVGKDGKTSYSNIINTADKKPVAANIWPNPVTDRLHVELYCNTPETVSYKLYNTAGIIETQGRVSLGSGLQNMSLPAESLSKGVYQLIIERGNGGSKPISFRFVKQ